MHIYIHTLNHHGTFCSKHLNDKHSFVYFCNYLMSTLEPGIPINQTDVHSKALFRLQANLICFSIQIFMRLSALLFRSDQIRFVCLDVYANHVGSLNCMCWWCCFPMRKLEKWREPVRKPFPKVAAGNLFISASVHRLLFWVFHTALPVTARILLSSTDALLSLWVWRIRVTQNTF